MMRIGIVGCGNIAHTLCSTMVRLKDHMEVVAVAARDEERAKAFAAEFGVPRAYGSYGELYRDEEVDLVYVGRASSSQRRSGPATCPRAR